MTTTLYHRFKGTDVTFEEFPDRIKHLVQATLPKVKVRSEVFPVYETKGDLVSSKLITRRPSALNTNGTNALLDSRCRAFRRLVDGAHSACRVGPRTSRRVGKSQDRAMRT